MIYYFSGTGNSRFAAEKLALMTGDRCIDIASIYKGKVKQAGGRTDVTGFVFPVYYSGLPEMVKRFASHREIKEHLAPYIYTVITCGAETGAADIMLEKALEHKINYSRSLKMPDNYVLLYDPCEKEKAIGILKEASSKLDKFAGNINDKRNFRQNSFKRKAVTFGMYPLYNLFRTTKFFKADNKCISCGLCASVCPDNAIEIVNGKPQWNKSKCQHCTACINRCPEEAIQFTMFTENRNRYNIINLR